ncbi:MAG: hypothetical protein BEN18_10610 [Epulopiscium sp. Nuni2H_MBin001]|nr:MAG: hypothetical protein BEN18_10610 [Epulopiscium sp. Nuni2H_MBin001]
MKRKKVHQIISILVGTFLLSISTNAILLPNKLLSGGLSGIAMFSNIVFGTNISIMVICLNIPLFVLAVIFLNKRFVAYSLFGMLSLSTWLEITYGMQIETVEPLTVMVLGGLIHGLGTGIIFRAEGSTGGIDIIAKIVNKYFSLSISTITFAINGCIMILSLIYFGVDLSVLTLSTMFVSTQVVHYVIDGIHKKRTIYIITDEEHKELVYKALLASVNRGITIIPAVGAYTQKSKFILYMNVGVREVAKVRNIVIQHDPNAFMTISEAFQVIGQGKGFIPTDTVELPANHKDKDNAIAKHIDEYIEKYKENFEDDKKH